jgi:hypothetical protein
MECEKRKNNRNIAAGLAIILAAVATVAKLS